MWSWVWDSVLCLWMPNFSSTICWSGCHSSIKLLLNLFQKSVVHIFLDLFLGPLFCSIHLTPHQYHSIYYYSYVCRNSWNWVDWFLPLSSSFPNCFRYSISFDFPHKFLSNLTYAYKKILWRFWCKWWNLHFSLGKFYIFTMYKCSNPVTQYASPLFGFPPHL